MKSKTFTDYDAFAESLEDVDARMMFQNAEQRRWTINQASLPNVHLQLGRLGSGNIVEGQSMSGGLLMYVPVTEDCEYRANGIIYKRGSIAVLEPGCEFCVASTAQHDWFSIYLPTGFLEDRGDKKESNIKRADVWVSHGNSRVVRQLQSLVREVMSHASTHSGFESTLAATLVEAELSRIAAKVAGRPLSGQGAASKVGRPVIPRDEIIRRCKQLLSVDSTGQVRIEDLLSCAHVSERTLRRAFQEYFGVGPTRYLQLRQLHQVRQTLKKSAPESTTVTNVLFDAGIWQLGRFATKFRQLFGETPSETLRARSC